METTNQIICGILNKQMNITKQKETHRYRNKL